MKKENPDDNELSLKNEIFGVFSLFFSFFLIFSLVSYTPLDPSFFHSAPARVVTNFGGRVGAELSALLFNLFGFASLLFIAIFLFLTAYFLFNRRIGRAVSKGVGFFILLLSLAALLANIKPQIADRRPGGAIRGAWSACCSTISSAPRSRAFSPPRFSSACWGSRWC